MDPQSQSFTPYQNLHDSWNIQTDVARIQQVQQEHSERIHRLERRQEEDARVKSVWGASSPFPSVLSGTPQQAPVQQPTTEHFRDFDEEGNALMSSLHLDAEDEPRRGIGAASRANSVRFDETANQNHFAHSNRASVELFSRSTSSLGGLPMNERSLSHKSDGRASSAHSMRSVASGRAGSLNLDPAFGMSDATRSLLDAPTLAPGLLFLGTTPAIVRCWMNTNFKHDALLYAAICTGSFCSYLDLRLILKLGFEENIHMSSDGVRTVELPVYFPEAISHPASSRSSSPAPQLPTITVEFEVVEYTTSEADKSIQIVLGSDVLRAHCADILFSSNIVTLVDDERSKLRIPLVRPENEATFKSLRTTSALPAAQPRVPIEANVPEAKKQLHYTNGVGQASSTASGSSTAASPPPGKYRPPGVLAAESSITGPSAASSTEPVTDPRPRSQQSDTSRPPLSILNTRNDVQEHLGDLSSQSAASRSGSGSAIWNSWRRDGTPSASTAPQTAGLDWVNASKSRETQYQRRETGIKVLKPKSASRAVSTSAASNALHVPGNNADGRSRFFDEGRRRSDQRNEAAPSPILIEKDNSTSQPGPSGANPNAPKTSPNPIGGGSAFSWLNSGGH